jgi:hypothetical protein
LVNSNGEKLNLLHVLLAPKTGNTFFSNISVHIFSEARKAASALTDF